MCARSSSEFQLEPCTPSERRIGKSRNYVPRFLYVSQSGEVVAADGPRRAFSNAERLVRRERIEFGLFVAGRRRVCAPTPSSQKSLPIVTQTNSTSTGHLIVRAIELANWTSEPRGMRLVNPPREKPQRKLSAKQREVLEILEATTEDSLPEVQLRKLYATRQAWHDAISALMRRGLVERLSESGASIRWTGKPWR